LHQKNIALSKILTGQKGEVNMKDNNQKSYTVEYELSGVVFFREVTAANFEEAKQQIQSGQPDAQIRAVSIIENQEEREITE
jgi:hypothetical protein